MNKLRSLSIAMITVILAVAGFQVYWLKDSYGREDQTLQTRSQLLFNETVRNMTDSLLQRRLKYFIGDSIRVNRLSFANAGRKTVQFVSVLGKTLKQDSLKRKISKQEIFITSQKANAEKRTQYHLNRVAPDLQNDSQPIKTSKIYFSDGARNVVIRLDSLTNDSLPLHLLQSKFATVLGREKLAVPFHVVYHKGTLPALAAIAPDAPDAPVSEYQLVLGNTVPFLFKQILWPIAFSLFLVGLTIIVFLLMYKNLVRQHRMAVIKNDLISNITHELKTPIATVNVAIEALKNFNAINDPQRTKEYLDISQSELQRLALLVDKVLKLSMFDNKKIVLKQEGFNLKEVVDEVVSSLRLHAEKIHARITVAASGDLNMRGDRLHILSVIFNLLDNAMKYSKQDAAIHIDLNAAADKIIFMITDNGIGIPAEYTSKIFEKFFRVPTGDTHNAKGHGLGLSYVAQVVAQHGGEIEVNSHENIGSVFTITFPKQAA